MDFLISLEHRRIPTDTAEEVSDFLLFPVRLALGRSIEDGEEKHISLLGRVVGISICLLALSVVFPITLIGIITNLFSKTHAEKMTDFRRAEVGYEVLDGE